MSLRESLGNITGAGHFGMRGINRFISPKGRWWVAIGFATFGRLFPKAPRAQVKLISNEWSRCAGREANSSGLFDQPFE